MEELMKKLDKKLKVTSYEYMDDILSINIERTNKSDICPCCGKKSTNIHSKYIITQIKPFVNTFLNIIFTFLNISLDKLFYIVYNKYKAVIICLPINHY